MGRSRGISIGSGVMKSKVKIVDKIIHNEGRAFLIAEVAQAHDGSLGSAHAYIDACADAGVDAVKFQTHLASEESTYDEPFRVQFTTQDSSRYEYWKRMEFTEAQWAGLKAHACDRGLVFLSSPFSLKAVDLLQRIGVAAWKVGSGEFWTDELLIAMAKTGKPIILSTGLAAFNEINDRMSLLTHHGANVILLQCTTQYPSELADVGLNVIKQLNDSFNVPTGLSDHTGSVIPSIAAIAQGASVVEVHVTFHKKSFGPDVPASLTLDDLALLARARNEIFEMRVNPVDKSTVSSRFGQTRKIFSKSLALKTDVKKGHKILRQNICLKKPGTGISIDDIESVVGRVAKKDLGPEYLLRWEDLLG